jgi:hypothetical protein
VPEFGPVAERSTTPSLGIGLGRSLLPEFGHRAILRLASWPPWTFWRGRHAGTSTQRSESGTCSCKHSGGV